MGRVDTTKLNIVRIVFFSLQLAFAICTLGVGAAFIHKELKNKDLINDLKKFNVTLSHQGIIAAASVEVAAAVLSVITCIVVFVVDFILGRGRNETKRINAIKLVVYVLLSLFFLGSLIALTVITAQKRVEVNVPILQDTLNPIVNSIFGDELEYRKQTLLRAYVVLAWFAWLFTTLMLGTIVYREVELLSNDEPQEGHRLPLYETDTANPNSTNEELK